MESLGERIEPRLDEILRTVRTHYVRMARRKEVANDETSLFTGNGTKYDKCGKNNCKRKDKK